MLARQITDMLSEIDFIYIYHVERIEFGRVLVRIHWYLGKSLLSSTMIFHSNRINEGIKKTIIRVINETNAAFVEGRFNERSIEELFN